MVNDGALVAGLAGLMGGLTAGVYLGVACFAFAKHGSSKTVNTFTKTAQLLSAWGNLGNAWWHILLTVLLATNKRYYLNAGIDDADNVLVPYGPGILGALNVLIGLRTLGKISFFGNGPCVPFYYNLAIAILGTAMPIVWLKFIATGLSSWPLEIIFLWFGIGACEATAFIFSVVWKYAAVDKTTKKE